MLDDFDQDDVSPEFIAQLFARAEKAKAALKAKEAAEKQAEAERAAAKAAKAAKAAEAEEAAKSAKAAKVRASSSKVRNTAHARSHKAGTARTAPPDPEPHARVDSSPDPTDIILDLVGEQLHRYVRAPVA